MNKDIAAQVQTISTLPSLIDRAAKALQGARSSAEVLEACDLATAAYGAAKLAGRMAKAKGAHDDLVVKAHRLQADALEIESRAKRLFADEYDAAQKRGELAKVSDGRRSSQAEDLKPTAADIGMTHKAIHEARTIRDAEAIQPGVVRKTLDEALAAGEEPTKAKVKKATAEAVKGSDAPITPKEDRQLRGKKPTAEDDLRDEIAELTENVEALEADVARLTAENKLYGEMKAEYEKGGFAEVIAGLEIQLKAKDKLFFLESKKAAEHAASAKHWRKIAIDLGYSRDEVIDLGALDG